MGEEADKRTEERKKENGGSGKEGRERKRREVGSRGSVIEKERRKKERREVGSRGGRWSRGSVIEKKRRERERKEVGSRVGRWSGGSVIEKGRRKTRGGGRSSVRRGVQWRKLGGEQITKGEGSQGQQD
jgi:hypothetical protein